MTSRIIFGDNLPVLQSLPQGSVELIYIDPPFTTGKLQKRTRIQVNRVANGENGQENGDRTGFAGRRYQTTSLGEQAYADQFEDYLAFLEPRLREAHRLLQPNGSLYFHIDYREVHYCKVLLDQIFGRSAFLNEIIWAYDYGARTRRKWPPKHDNILWYARDPEHYIFDSEAVERIPYMTPGLVGPEKAARGKLPTDTWWHTIVGTNSKEKTGYPTQKPAGVLRRILQASSTPGGMVMDFFAGSGTTGAVCLEMGREFILVDNNPQAMAVMQTRFAGVETIEWINWPKRPNGEEGN